MSIFDDPGLCGRLYAGEYTGDIAANADPDPGPAVEFLADLAGRGARGLELAIGAGRVALPLAARGINVDGVEGLPRDGRPSAPPPPVGATPSAMRYLWPEQIDELATQAGLTLSARYADWRRTASTPASPDHVSVNVLS